MWRTGTRRESLPPHLTFVLLAIVPALGLVVTTGGKAAAHGTPMKPGSRTFRCWRDQ